MVPSGHAWWVATILDRTGLERGLLTSLWWCWGSRWPRLSSPLHPWCTSLRWGVGCTCRREKVVRPHVASHSRGSWGAGAWGGKGWWSSGQRKNSFCHLEGDLILSFQSDKNAWRTFNFKNLSLNSTSKNREFTYVLYNKWNNMKKEGKKLNIFLMIPAFPFPPLAPLR